MLGETLYIVSIAKMHVRSASRYKQTDQAHWVKVKTEI
jgi:hypothetical protein